MFTSMTGYGRANASSKYGKFLIEIQSVNRKFLETFVILPKELMRFEVEIKRWISDHIKRGQITVRIVLSPETKEVSEFLPNEILLKKLSNSWKSIARKLHLDEKQVNLQFLAQQSQQLITSSNVRHEEKIREVLKKGINIALREMILMKKKEGSILATDMQKRLKYLAKKIKAIEKSAPDSALRFKNRLLQKVKEFFPPQGEIDERVLKEIAIYSEKVDITEEIIRFCSHLEQFTQLLKEKKNAIGRKMDFIIQEMFREINTIAAKSSEVSISRNVIEIKAELEKIREQVQNIE